jgi:hypothetical protein
VSLKSDKNRGFFGIMVLQRVMFQAKFERKSEHKFYFKLILSENRAVYEIIWKYILSAT